MFDMFNSESSQSSNSSSSYSSSDSYSNSCASNSSTKKGFVISAGGSIFIQEKPLTEKIKSFCETINELGNDYNFVIVVGGGKTARNYIDSAKELGATNFELDTIGITASRLNAMLFVNGIKKSSEKVLTDFYDAKKVLSQGKIPIFGGMAEGQTSDAVAALLSELLGYEFINLSNVDGIYDSDPNQNPDAELFRELSFNDMNYLLKEKLLIPGQKLFVDPQAASILSRSKVISFFLNGDHLENFRNCLKGNEFKGTIVHEISDIIEKTVPKINVPVEEEVEEAPPAPKRRLFRKRIVEDEEINPRDIDFG